MQTKQQRVSLCVDQNQLEFHWNYLNSLSNTVIGKHMNGKNNTRKQQKDNSSTN